MNLTRESWRSANEETETGRSRIFTDHVRALAAGKPLDSREFEAVWAALRAALKNELKKRGLWESPPSYLGVYGGESWAPATAPARPGSALEELLAECYSYIFVSRLRSLEAQLKVKPNIDGMVFLNIRHFLHERQKEHDPIGFQIFEVLQSAVRLAVEEGELRVLSGGEEKVRNDTVLGFEDGMESSGRGRGELPSVVARWNDDLLPDLVTSRGRGQEEVMRRLRERLPDLRREGIATFRFKDLVDPLKTDVRARWAALLDLAFGVSAPQKEGVEGGKTPVRLVEPDASLEERELFHKLVDCVLTSLRRLQVDEKTRGYLNVLWQFLRVRASEGMERVSRLDRALRAEMEIEDEERPSLRKLAEQLHIPRERLPGLYKKLGELLERCRAANSGKAAVTLLKRKSIHDRQP